MPAVVTAPISGPIAVAICSQLTIIIKRARVRAMPRKHHHPIPLNHIVMGAPVNAAEIIPSNEIVEGKPIHLGHHQGHMRRKSFMGRLQKALMTLGVWEGRIVAFVIGTRCVLCSYVVSDVGMI